MKAALGDAALMTAMERNSDLIIMHCYAPLMTNINSGASQWRPNMIGYNALQSFGSPSYYAFKMFSQNHGDTVVTSSLENAPTGSIPPLHYVVTRDAKRGTLFIKMVNVTGTPQKVNLVLQGVTTILPIGKVLTLSAQKPEETNSIQDPTHLIPVESDWQNVGLTFSYTFLPYSVTILKVFGSP